MPRAPPKCTSCTVNSRCYARLRSGCKLRKRMRSRLTASHWKRMRLTAAHPKVVAFIIEIPGYPSARPCCVSWSRLGTSGVIWSRTSGLIWLMWSYTAPLSRLKRSRMVELLHSSFRGLAPLLVSWTCSTPRQLLTCSTPRQHLDALSHKSYKAGRLKARRLTALDRELLVT
jgi:hypothetical protein